MEQLIQIIEGMLDAVIGEGAKNRAKKPSDFEREVSRIKAVTPNTVFSPAYAVNPILVKAGWNDYSGEAEDTVPFEQTEEVYDITESIERPDSRYNDLDWREYHRNMSLDGRIDEDSVEHIWRMRSHQKRVARKLLAKAEKRALLVNVHKQLKNGFENVYAEHCQEMDVLLKRWTQLKYKKNRSYDEIGEVYDLEEKIKKMREESCEIKSLISHHRRMA